ncbi:MAG: tetratricopeptide repeat protein [Bacteroidales bacterium]
MEARLQRFGLQGPLGEEALRDLAASLLGEKKVAKALEVLEYRATSYPRSAEAQIALGDAYRQSGNVEKARDCYKRALVLAPGHAAATAKLKEVERTSTEA